MADSRSPAPRPPWVRGAVAVLALALLLDVVYASLTMNRQAWPQPARVSPLWLVIAAGLAFVPWLTMTLRLCIWSPLTGSRLPFREAFKVTVAGELGNAVTPTVAGGGAMKLLVLVRRGLSSSRASALLLLLTLEDAVFFAVSLPVAYALSSGSAGPVVRSALAAALRRGGAVLAGAVLLALIATWALRAIGRGSGSLARTARLPGWGRVAAWGRELAAVLKAASNGGGGRFPASLALAFVQWICRYSVAAAILRAFGISVFLPLQILLQWVVFTAGTIVPTPGGATAIESAFAVIYRPFVPAPWLGTVTALWRFLLFYLVVGVAALALGLYALRSRQRSRTGWNLNPASMVPENEVTSAPGT